MEIGVSTKRCNCESTTLKTPGPFQDGCNALVTKSQRVQMHLLHPCWIRRMIQLILIHIQLRKMNMASLLNNPYVKEVTLTEQKLY